VGLFCSICDDVSGSISVWAAEWGWGGGGYIE